MGTTFRSAMSWGVEVSAVELVGSVRDAFGYYFDDALLLMQNPRGSIVIDDGRRFLQRNAQMYDVVTVDPPPPVEAAGSSLLYSKDFLKIVKKRLNRGGIMHHWLPASPGFDLLIVNAVSRSIVESFPHVRAFVSIEDWGIHFLASMEAIDIPSEEKLLARMPADARLDLEEWVWSQDDNASTFIHRMFKQEIDVTSLLGDDSTLVITDDRPFNEYYLLRRWLK
jgi:spermidine synthase